MYLARCYAQLGSKTASENNWQRALEAAEADAPQLLTLGDYDEKKRRPRDRSQRLRCRDRDRSETPDRLAGKTAPRPIFPRHQDDSRRPR